MQHPDGSLHVGERHGRTLASWHIAQGSTNDCGPHVVTEAVNFWKGEALLSADDVARSMNRPRVGMGLLPLVVRRVPNWATFPWGIADELRVHGIPARWQLKASEDDLQAALREDRLIMPIFGEPLRRQGLSFTGWSHVVLLEGWDPATETYWFVDSARTSAPTSRPRAEFVQLWGNMGRLIVETR